MLIDTLVVNLLYILFGILLSPYLNLIITKYILNSNKLCIYLKEIK